MDSVQIKFIARWALKEIRATNDGTGYAYVINHKYLPLQEVIAPLGVPAEIETDDQYKALHAANALDLVSSLSGHNVDFSQLLCEPVTIRHRVLTGSGIDPVQAGDSLLVAVPVG